MPLLPRQNIAGIEEGRHGGIDYADLEGLGIDPDKIIDFSVSSSPRGIPPGIRPLVKSTRLSRYPDSQCIKLRRMIACKTGMPADNIISGSGSTELIRLAALAYLDASHKALIIQPTYGEYRLAC
jgi:histidinol-phosphate/aromatic aminotransferase/cobyric acid decarboxylase-like protein